MGIQSLNRDANSDAGDPSPADGSLLDQFIRERSDEAFAMLMKRHGPYVLGVCRRVTQHPQDAEDVFQACFLELARKASTISRRNSVAGWLQTVAVRMARKAVAQCARRQHHQTMYRLTDLTAPENDISWRQIRRILEEQLALLPEDLRLPIILCHFEGRTQEEAAQCLKIKPRTLKDRLVRGRAMLRKRLTRCGVSLTALGVLLSGGRTAVAVSSSLHETTLRGATAVAKNAALAVVIPPGVLSLMRGSALLSGSPLLAAGLVGLVLFGSTAFVAWGAYVGTGAGPTHGEAPANRVTLRYKKGEDRTDKFVKTASAVHEEGLARLRVVRRGASFSIFSADQPTDEFQLMATFETSSADATIVRFAADPGWSAVAAVDVRLVDASIKAEEIVGYVP
jgi:RNA polymerase sigma factor (sigma-70 family)